jgi:hypothetical protein
MGGPKDPKADLDRLEKEFWLAVDQGLRELKGAADRFARDMDDAIKQHERQEQLKKGLRESAVMAGRAVKRAVDALPIPDSVRSTAASIVAQILNPVRLPPASYSESEQFEHYKRMLEARGFTLDPSHPTVVALRGLNSSDGSVHAPNVVNRYDETIVVLSKDAKGDTHVKTFAGSTHPDRVDYPVGGTVGVPTVDDDQIADVGMINPGEYRLEHRADHNGAAAWDVRTPDNSGRIPGVRDTDHDGVFSEAERSASQTRVFQDGRVGDTLTGVMIHQGGPNSPASAGCVNISSKSTDYPEFIKAVGGTNATSMKLIVMDANAP